VTALPAFAPAPLRGIELLDDPSTDATLALRSLQDVAAANRWFGGTQAVLSELRPLLRDAAARGTPLSLLDLGSGAGDILVAARRLAGRLGAQLRTIGLERTLPLAHAGLGACGETLAADALALPFADGTVDVVMCSQVLHHFEGEAAEALVREMHRVAGRAVLISDIRRAWGALAGVWLGSFLLGFHPVSRHDGVVSVRRGFRAAELARIVERATGVRPSVHDRLGFRVTTCWSTGT
jgi:SAM-dependent methyltransferase